MLVGVNRCMNGILKGKGRTFGMTARRFNDAAAAVCTADFLCELRDVLARAREKVLPDDED